MDRKDVYEIIAEERDYQDGLEHHSKSKDEKHSVADWIIFMERKLNQAKEMTYQLNEDEAIQQVIKVTALGVACLEYRFKVKSQGLECNKD